MFSVKSVARFFVVSFIISLMPQALYAGDGVKRSTIDNNCYYSYMTLEATRSIDPDGTNIYGTKWIMEDTYNEVDDYRIFNNWPPEEYERIEKTGEYKYISNTKTHYLYSPEDYYYFSLKDQHPTLADKIKGELLPTETGKKLGDRTPIILVHGWQGANDTANPYAQTDVELSPEEYWKNFIEFFTQYHNLKSRFKIYVYKYPSYKHVTFNAAILKNMLRSENAIPELREHFKKKNGAIFVAHSMGTILVRSAFEEHKLSPDYAEKIILLDGVHHGSPAAVPGWVSGNTNPIAGRDLYTLGANDIQWDNYDAIFNSAISRNVFEDITNNFGVANVDLVGELGIKQMDIYNSNDDSVDFFYGNIKVKGMPSPFFNETSFRINETYNFDMFFRKEISELKMGFKEKGKNITLPVFKIRENAEYEYLIGTLSPLNRNWSIDAVLPLTPNPWLTIISLKYQDMPNDYKRKLILFGAINANGGNENNHVTDGWSNIIMGVAEDGVQHLGELFDFNPLFRGHYGYLNDGPVPISGQLLDLRYSFDELVQQSQSNQVTMYAPWKEEGLDNGNSTIKIFRYSDNEYEGDGYATHVLFMDYHHDRMKSGAYSEEGSDSLLEYNSPHETGFENNSDRKSYINSALTTGGISFWPDDQELEGNELRLEPLFLSIASQIAPSNFLLSSLNKEIFPDVNQRNPYINAIASLYEKGIIQGHPDGTFKPHDHLNRAEASKIIVEAAEAAGIKLVLKPTTHQQLSEQFGDIIGTEEWYEKYIGKLFGYGAVSGYPDGTEGYSPGPFLPGKIVSRAEMLKMVVLTFFPLEPVSTGPALGIAMTGPGTVAHRSIEYYWFYRYIDKANQLTIKPFYNGLKFISISNVSDIVDEMNKEIPASRQETVKAVYDAYTLYRSITH
ncbi:MAG: S-layer homology domain-containing protein [Candidatus Electronema aureum]|uniref:S-layer homology domain-containing protein n=1 Tax=Candidatus Electronema aureum TaxID=2005002 RepID=A0A521G5S6_9BACT|nr:MAG: S-layer homology domain-containing protein [Candidatus Electronema aureum]